MLSTYNTTTSDPPTPRSIWPHLAAGAAAQFQTPASQEVVRIAFHSKEVSRLRAVMRIYSFLFHGLLALFLLAVSLVALTSGAALHLEMLPWSGQTATYVLLGASLFGLLCLLLALKRTARLLFFLWSLAVFVLLVKWFFLSPYRFGGAPGFRTAVYLTIGSLLAIFGAWFQLRRKTA
jgi:hypothetical protein